MPQFPLPYTVTGHGLIVLPEQVSVLSELYSFPLHLVLVSYLRIAIQLGFILIQLEVCFPNLITSSGHILAASCR